MNPRNSRQRSTARVFAVYAGVTLALIVLLGVVLAAGFRAEAERRGLAAGTAEALLVAQTAIEPQLANHPLSEGLSSTEKSDMSILASRAVAEGSLLRLRLRDLSGKVVFSGDGSGFNEQVEGEVLQAAKGATVSSITPVNSDANDKGTPGPESVEVYMPLMEGSPAEQIGVLEIYVPYAPIANEIDSGTHELYLLLGVGLSLLYVALFFVSLSVTRRLHNQLTANTYLAEHDALTELPNQATFRRRITILMASTRSDSIPMAIANIDIDRFKIVNDTLGHEYGDKLLVEISRRLADHVDGEDAVARLGGDEFGIILSASANPAAELWHIKELIERELVVEGFPNVSLNCSVGYVIAYEDGNTVEGLLQRAEIAMYVAKEQHVGVLRYDPIQDQYEASALSLVTELRRAIDADELVMHYQPQVQLADQKPIALEALVRWQHPKLGLLVPEQFVPLVEQTDLIHELTDWALARALKDLHSLGELADDVSVAVNASARNLARSDFTQRVAASIAASGIEPERLILEITETALLSHPERARNMLLAISALGVRISLDDFGIGQTSLSHIASLPIAELKIDKSFVIDMITNPVHAAIVRSIVDLGQGLGMHVIAEGVETEFIARALADVGCDFGQGFLFSKPRSLNSIREWLGTRPSATRSL